MGMDVDLKDLRYHGNNCIILKKCMISEKSLYYNML